ncbi:MAG: HyaD/HybD family hydrogenase maturation endopeptidase [Rhodocyclaceae bacterium]|nr:HyaD/HybD family hydrogenase maturation endopeptidase [Rhodocyclaceae bacterium]
MHAVILGIGNIILSDEGVGVRAVEALEKAYRLPEGVAAIDGGTSSMELLDDLSDLDLLVVLDTIMAGKPPGTIIRLTGEEVPVFFRRKLSPHQISLADVLASLELIGHLPKEVVVIGVQPVTLELGLDLTPTVAAQVPQLVALAAAEFSARGCALEPLGAVV